MSTIKFEHFEWSLVTGAITLSIAIFSFSLIRMISYNAPMPDERSTQLWAARFIGGRDILATVGGSGAKYDTPRGGQLVLWDVKTGRETFVVKQKSPLRAIASSPDGHVIATGDFEGNVRLIDTTTGTKIGFLQCEAGVNAITYFPSNNVVVSGDLGGTITIWDIVNKKAESIMLTNEAILNLVISDDCKTVIATTRNGMAYMVDLLHTERRKALRAYDGAATKGPNVEGVAFSPGEKLFATACQNQLRIWQYPIGTLIRSFDAPTSVNSLAFSPDGTTLACVDSDGTLALWDPLTGKCRIKTNAHIGTSFCVTFSADGKRIATVGRNDFYAKIWDAQTLAPIKILTRIHIKTQ